MPLVNKRSRCSKAVQSVHYGTPTANSLHLLRYHLEEYPEDAAKFVLCIKGALARTHEPACRPKAIRASVDEAYRVFKGVRGCMSLRWQERILICQSILRLRRSTNLSQKAVSEALAGTIRRARVVHDCYCRD